MFRKVLLLPKAFFLLLLLPCIGFPLTALNEMKNSAERDAYAFRGYNRTMYFDDHNSNYVSQSSEIDQRFNSVFTDSLSFCFLPPLLGVPSAEHERKPVSVGISESKSDRDVGLIEISGVAKPEMKDKCNDTALHVYQPFSTDNQFYPCVSSEVSLVPGEAASICSFMVLPRWLGSSSVCLLLQTSAAFLVLLYCLCSQILAFGSEDQFFENKGIFNCFHNSQKKGNASISAEIACFIRSIGEKILGKHADGSSEHGLDSLLQTPVMVNSSQSNEASETVNLTVKTGKDKKRRRKKKKGVLACSTAIVEGSSSLSGNSSPSSPMSPVFTYRQFQETANNPFAGVTSPLKPGFSDQKSSIIQVTPNQSVLPHEQISKPVLSYSATFPSAGNRSVCSIQSHSSLAPHARAPGSRFCDHKQGKVEEKTRTKTHEYTYDIWGDNLSWLQLINRLNDKKGSGFAEDESMSFFTKGPQSFLQNKKGFGFAEDESMSFFVKGPQNLLPNSQPKYVSFFDQVG